MLQFGHLRELKEWKGLVPFLTQVAMQVHGLVHLIQPDGTVVYKFIPSEGNYLAACLNKDWQVEIVARWRSSHSPNQPQETTCFCGKPLLIIPIVWRNRIDGILTACSFIEEDHHFLICVAGIIGDYVSLARSAVHDWEKWSTTLGAHYELYHKTEYIEGNIDIYSKSLEILQKFLDTDIEIFIPRSSNGMDWESSFTQNNSGMSEKELISLSSLIITLFNEDRFPMIITPDGLADYPELDQFGVFSLLSVTVVHKGDVIGLVVLCSRQKEKIFSFDDLALLESLKGIIALRLYDFQVQNSQKRFLENALHNLRTPVHSIVGLAEILATRDEMSPSARQELLELLSHQAERLAALVKRAEEFIQLRRFSRPRTRISLKEIVQEGAAEFLPLAASKSIEISVDVPMEGCNIVANKDDLYEVIQNLIENAIKFSPIGKIVQIKLVVESSNYRVSVTDEGLGVPEEQRGIIFEEFCSILRGNEPESSRLGLPFARAIIDAYGGALDCSDSTNNRGAYFWFTLPRNDDSLPNNGV